MEKSKIEGTEIVNARELVSRFFKGSEQEKALIIAGDLKKLADSIVEQKGVSKHQIRKYYHSLLEVSKEVELSGESLEGKLLKVALLKSYISYDSNRSQNRIKNKNFISFVQAVVDEILKRKNKESLELATILFEALVGYTASLKK